MSFQVGNFKSSTGLDAKKAAIEAAKAKSTLNTASRATMVKYISPNECADRTRIVFDDSGSMGSNIQKAKTGVVEYLRNCIPNQSAVAIHFMNTQSQLEKFTSDLPALAVLLNNICLESGGTPFFNSLKIALEAKPRLTRLIVFTDGSPTDTLTENSLARVGYNPSRNRWLDSADLIIELSKSQSSAVPIDTVFFGNLEYSSGEIELLKYLSDKTGGFFLHFDPSKPNIWKQLKYLAPVNRLSLTDGAFRAKIEKGE